MVARDVTLCPVVLTGRTGHAQHAAFAATYWASEIPSLNVTVRFVGTYEAGSSTVRGVVGSFVLQSAGCDAVIGPGISDDATAMNAMVNQMWVEFGATTTDFSNRFVYPYFNRVIPDAQSNQGVFAAILKSFGWSRINMLCTSTSYGQSVASVLATSLGESSAAFTNNCVSNGLGYNDTRPLIEAMLSSPSRVIYFAFSATDPIAKAAVQVVKDLNLTQSKILLWSDSNCGSGGTAWAFPGSYCATYMVNATRYNTFYEAYSSRSKTMFSGEIAALGFPSSQIDYNSSKGNQQAYAADAARVALHALDRYYATNTVPPSQALDAAAAAVRATELPDGLSGYVSLPQGDRVTPWVRVYNALPDGTIAVAAEHLPDGTVTINDQQFVLGGYHSKTSMPYDVPPPPPAPPPYWAIGVALGLLLMLGVAVAYAVRRHLRLAARPLDGTAPFAVMFIGVKNEAEVRDLGKANASAALGHIRQVVKDAVRATGCFEARRMDEATVMIVSKTVENALACAGRISRTVEGTDWTTLLHHQPTQQRGHHHHHHHHSAHETRSSSKSFPGPLRSARASHQHRHDGERLSANRHQSHTDGRSTVRSNHSSLAADHGWPRVNIGLHFGFGMIEHDAETEFVSYHGAVVARAVSVADAAQSRQVLVSHEVVTAVEESGSEALDGRFQPLELSNASDDASLCFVYLPRGLSAQYEASVLMAKQAAPFESAGIATALSTADAGLAKRRVAVLSIRLPELVTAKCDALRDTSIVLNDIKDIAAEHRGTIISVTETELLIGVNCVGPMVSQAPARAASMALHLAAAFEEDIRIGLAAGTVMTAPGVCLGSVCSTARIVQLVAAATGTPLAAASSALQDLDSKFQLFTIDCVATPKHPTAPCRVFAILSEIVANDEWLYAMSQTDSVRVNETVWSKIIKLVSSPPAAATNDAKLGDPAEGSTFMMGTEVAALRATLSQSQEAVRLAKYFAASLLRLEQLCELHSQWSPSLWQQRLRHLWAHGLDIDEPSPSNVAP